MTTRRQFLSTSLAAPVAASLTTTRARAAVRSPYGIATTSYMTVWRPKDTMEFFDHCEKLGAAGIQAQLSSQDPAFLRTLRDRAEKAGMYIEVMGGLPGNNPEVFTRLIRAAKEVGALCLRSSSPLGRRYEKFTSWEQWQKESAVSVAAIERGAKIAEQERFPWAIENHKDWTAEEMAAMFKRVSSEYCGVCVDTGNNISMLDDPYDTVERLAPYALSCHIKDMGVAPVADGFHLSEIVLGQGFLDLSRMVKTIHQVRPKVKLTLEMITRDPLHVPCLTENYWTSFRERNGVYLARTMRLVHDKVSKLPMLSPLAPAAQRAEEEANVRKCLEYRIA